MAEPFTQEFRARWADMDWNQHMRNAAFLGCSEETRMRYLDSRGFTMEELLRRRLGPVVVEDRLVYRQELKLLERFRVDLALVASTGDARRVKLRNRFFRASDGAPCATVESVVLWLDLDARRAVPPPPDLRDLWLSLARTEDFETI